MRRCRRFRIKQMHDDYKAVEGTEWPRGTREKRWLTNWLLFTEFAEAKMPWLSALFTLRTKTIWKKRNSPAHYRMAWLRTEISNVQEAGQLFMLYLVPALSNLPRKNSPEGKLFIAKVNVTAITAPETMWLTDINTRRRWFFRKTNKSMKHDQQNLRKSTNRSEDHKTKWKSPHGDEVSLSWYTCHSSNPAKGSHEQSKSPWELAEEPLARTK